MTWKELETQNLGHCQIHGSPTLQPTGLKSATILKPLASMSCSKLLSHQTKMLLCWFWTAPSPLSGCMMIFFLLLGLF